MSISGYIDMDSLIADTFTGNLAKPTGDEQKAIKTTDKMKI